MAERKPPLGNLLVLGAADLPGLITRLDAQLAAVQAGHLPDRRPPTDQDLAAAERLVIDWEQPEELPERLARARQALENGGQETWKRLEGQGIYRGSGAPGGVAMMFGGQGSQYVNMLHDLRQEPVVAETFAQADQVLTPILGRPLTAFIFADPADQAAQEAAETQLRDTRITQPAVLTVDVALYRLLQSYNIQPDWVIGHSLGEYAALVAAGTLDLADALRVVHVRGRAMSEVAQADNGAMAAIMASPDRVAQVLSTVEGYVTLCNLNSRNQVVIGGETAAVEQAIAACAAAKLRAVRLAVSHAFHTRIVQGAADPLRAALAECTVRPPHLPVIANVTGEPYPDDPSQIIALLERQVYSPVQFVKGLETLYALGARVFVEVGPKRVLAAFVEETLTDAAAGPDRLRVIHTNHPRRGARLSFHQAMCALYAAGLG